MKDKLLIVIIAIACIISFSKTEALGKATSITQSMTTKYTFIQKQDNNIIIFKYKNLENGIREKINKTKGDIYKNDVKDIEELTLNNKEISSLEGIQYLKNLSFLDLSENKISDIKALGSLLNLETLNLDKNKIKNTKGLSTLKSLKSLRLSENEISDINELGLLTKLVTLNLSDNRITDIKPLASLKGLMNLDISNNKIKDITPLKVKETIPLTLIDFRGNPLPKYVFKDELKEEYILETLYPYIDSAIEKYYGDMRQFMNPCILNIDKSEGIYKIKVRVTTFVGAHNPPYGIDTITITNDGSEVKVIDFNHVEEK